MKPLIIVTGGNCENWIVKCLNSIISQTARNWTCQVILDPLDGAYEQAHAIALKDSRIHVHLNNSRKYALANIVKAIELLQPKDDDVIFQIDGDDWLIDDNAIMTVMSYYMRRSDLLFTHGSWIDSETKELGENCLAYVEFDFKHGVRASMWKATQPKSFKYSVWKMIDDKDLRDRDGNYFRSAWDLAFGFPILEMAGLDRIQFIPNKIYAYNRRLNPHCDGKIHREEQVANEIYIRGKKSYERLK